MKSGNPVLSDSAFGAYPRPITPDRTMTMQGAVNKTGILLILVIAGAYWPWRLFFENPTNPAAVSTWMMVGVFGGFILALVTAFKQEWAPVTAPVYAVLEGLFLGGVSAIAEASYPGIAMQAVGLTFGVCIAMMAAYSSGVIKATEKFKLGVMAATGGIALVYLASLILGIFGVRVPMIYDNGLMGIGFSVVVVTIAALNLVLDFDFIETSAARGLPKYMEWYAAFSLMVTLIWLYIEILRLLIKLRSRD
jgi:uncharacterized YccA/Bax inhibitor family protein